MEREGLAERAATTIPAGLLILALGPVLLAGCPDRTRSATGESAATPAGAVPARAQAPLQLPPELEKYRDVLQSSVKPFVRITGKAGPTKPWESKFAGDPYFPKGEKYPLDEKGKPMKLLAQINFAEVPDIGLFPRKGIVEFFLAAPDDVYGLDFDHPTGQRNFRILYFEDVVLAPSRLVQDFGFAAAKGELQFPVGKEARLSFAIESAPVSLSDHRSATLLKPDGWSFFDRFGAKADQLREAYDERFPGNGHKMGGYAFFTQSDPREGMYADHDVLLLQIDTDDELDIMWGDAGVANFFVREADLRKASFSDVLYNWDCY